MIDPALFDSFRLLLQLCCSMWLLATPILSPWFFSSRFHSNYCHSLHFFSTHVLLTHYYRCQFTI